MEKNTFGIAGKLKHFPWSLDLFSDAEFVLTFWLVMHTFREDPFVTNQIKKVCMCLRRLHASQKCGTRYTVGPCFTDNHLIVITDSFLVPGEPHIFSKFNPLNTDTFYGPLSLGQKDRRFRALFLPNQG